MGNEYYGVPTTPTSDYLAHYGIKGMKWGVRKARESGNVKALGRQYRKAEKKLAKLEKRAASGKKYAKRAALMGAGAAAAGGLAAVGTGGVGRLTNAVGQGMQTAGYGANRVLGKHLNGKVGRAIRTANTAIGKAGQAVSGTQKHINAWGNSNSIGGTLKKAGRNFSNNNPNIVSPINKQLMKSGHAQFVDQTDKLGKISNSGYARLAAAGVGAGLAAGAGYNAYRAATTKRAAKKAQQFRSEMNKAFAGTQYANGSGQKKRRRR